MKIFVVDAFTDRPFQGNPAGVCLLDGPATRPWSGDADWMQHVAAEMRHAETAFVRARGADPGAGFELRWFTPQTEVALCGHATLASAHVLFTTGAIAADRPALFHTRHSGVLTVRHRGTGGLEMDFPAQPARETEPPAGLAEAFGAPVRWTGRNAQNDILALLDDEAAVRGLAPDLAALARIDARGIGVTAAAAPVREEPGREEAGRDEAGRDEAGYDFVSRFFGPRVGVPEDPVTGSAHCMLGPYWGDRLGRTVLTGRQVSPRGGTVRVTMEGDRVLLGGRAVTVLEGELRA